MKNHNWAVRLATLDLPKSRMPGTIGAFITCIGVVNFCYFNQVFNLSVFLPITVFLLALPIIYFALKYFNESDPAVICLDEVVGMLVALCLIKINLYVVCLAFLLFRLIDIVKPLGIKKIEKLPGVWGILLDDVVAGIYANLALNLILWFF